MLRAQAAFRLLLEEMRIREVGADVAVEHVGWKVTIQPLRYVKLRFRHALWGIA